MGFVVIYYFGAALNALSCMHIAFAYHAHSCFHTFNEETSEVSFSLVLLASTTLGYDINMHAA